MTMDAPTGASDSGGSQKPAALPSGVVIGSPLMECSFQTLLTKITFTGNLLRDKVVYLKSENIEEPFMLFITITA